MALSLFQGCPTDDQRRNRLGNPRDTAPRVDSARGAAKPPRRRAETIIERDAAFRADALDDGFVTSTSVYHLVQGARASIHRITATMSFSQSM